MNLNQARKLAIDLMNQHNLIGWRFRYDKAVRRLGLTKHSTKTISLSKPLTALNDEPQVKNTILHEIAHVLVGWGHGHDDVWRTKALEIGCNGNRVTDSIVNVTPTHTIKCLQCGASWGSFRKPRSLVNTWHKVCGRASINKLVLV